MQCSLEYLSIQHIIQSKKKKFYNEKHIPVVIVFPSLPELAPTKHSLNFFKLSQHKIVHKRHRHQTQTKLNETRQLRNLLSE